MTLVPRERVHQWVPERMRDVPQFRQETVDEVSQDPRERRQATVDCGENWICTSISGRDCRRGSTRDCKPRPAFAAYSGAALVDHVEAVKIALSERLSERMCEQFGVIEVSKNSSQEMSKMESHVTQVLNGIARSVAPTGLEKALSFEAVRLASQERVQQRLPQDCVLQMVARLQC